MARHPNTSDPRRSFFFFFFFFFFLFRPGFHPGDSERIIRTGAIARDDHIAGRVILPLISAAYRVIRHRLCDTFDSVSSIDQSTRAPSVISADVPLRVTATT